MTALLKDFCVYSRVLVASSVFFALFMVAGNYYIYAFYPVCFDYLHCKKVAFGVFWPRPFPVRFLSACVFRRRAHADKNQGDVQGGRAGGVHAAARGVPRLQNATSGQRRRWRPLPALPPPRARIPPGRARQDERTRDGILPPLDSVPALPGQPPRGGHLHQVSYHSNIN